MTLRDKKPSVVLFLGDLTCLIVALWLSLFLRHLSLPSNQLFLEHLSPFIIIFILWIFVFFIAGLYEKRAFYLSSKLSETLLNVQAVNSILAVIFFYFTSYKEINPKTILFIYVFTATAFIFLWRFYGTRFTLPSKKDNFILISGGDDAKILIKETSENAHYGLNLSKNIDPEKTPVNEVFSIIVNIIAKEKISIVIIDFKDNRLEPLFSKIHNLALDYNFQCMGIENLYENIFERVPLSYVKDHWFADYPSTNPRLIYDTLKRLMDIIISITLAIPSMIIFPFVFIAIKLEDGGPIFIKQERLGKENKSVFVHKLRTMKESDRGVWQGESKNEVTRVGSFLRITSFDELPQLWNVIKGEMSLVGPRNDIIGIAEKLETSIPFHFLRYMVKPGITGWAQTHQIYAPGKINPQSIEDSKMRFAYDLYYIKNRSFFLDLNIALKTIKVLLSRTGK